MDRFHLRPLARHWLRSPSLVGPEADDDDAGGDWDRWVLGRMARGALLDVGGVLVDQAVLDQRFECVSEVCAPRRGRGRYRSCCADLDVALTAAEGNRLRRHTHRLWPWLTRREPRLRPLQKQDAGHPFWLAVDAGHLSRPGGRCVFSQLQARDPKRIRCHLHAYARAHDVERQTVQPLPCRLFPLILVELPTGGVLLTTLYARTTRLVGSFPVSRFPCLGESKRPLLTQSLARDLDWLFGRGFARALRRFA
jgi:hypothetical protein